MNQKQSIFLSEEEKLKIHLQTSRTERFYGLMNLIRLTKGLQNSKIVASQFENFGKQKIPAITGIRNKIK